MPLTDPELDLLRELLQEDPGNEAYIVVAGELVGRGDFAEASQVLVNGLNCEPKEEGWALLVHAAIEAHLFDQARQALDHLDKDPITNPEYARLEVQVLSELGDCQEAMEAAQRFLSAHPDDASMVAQVDEIELSKQQDSLTTPDPFCTVARAEQYARYGQRHRAIRIYRRILFHNPNHKGVASRLRLLQTPSSDKSLLAEPPYLRMPPTTLRHVADLESEDEEAKLAEKLAMNMDDGET